MRLLSSKKICILIAVLGITAAGALLGGSAVLQSRSRQQFAGDGYVVTVSQNEDDQVVNLQNKFIGGTEWKRGFLSDAVFRNDLGEKVTVPDDSFIHYQDGSFAAMSGGSLADMDEYQNGVIGIYYLERGNRLTESGDSFQGETDQGEKEFGNFIWRTSSRRYLIGSPSMTVQLSGGKEITASGTMELYYYDKGNGIVQFTDGTDAWQVVSEGCTLTLDNGVTLDCDSGELTRADASGDESADTGKTLNLQEITTGAATGFTRTAANTGSYDNTEESTDPGQAPVFNFTLIDGEDGEDGTDGENGEAGPAGNDGSTGENGTGGKKGEDGVNGSNGADGVGGGLGVSGANGGVDPGISVKVGTPEVITPTWQQEGTSLTFTLQYEEQSYDAIDPTKDKAYVYLYDLATGEILWEQTAQTITDEESDPYIVDPNLLKMDTTYCLTVIDTYTLTGATYTTRVLEKIFTTDESGIQVKLTRPGETSVGLGIFSGKQDYITIKRAEITLTAEGGTEIGPKIFDSEAEEIDFSNLNLEGLTSNTNYRANLKISYEIVDKGNQNKTTLQEKTISYTFTTLKKHPQLGGLSLRAEEGSLVADVQGIYNTTNNRYDGVTDPDGALVSVTYYLYDETEIKKADGRTPLMTQTVNKNSSAYFKVDGELLRNGQSYYVIADYTMNDGSGEVTLQVDESNPAGTTYGSVNSKDLGRAFAACKATRGNGISLSFNGNGTGIFNTPDDQSEGTTYASILGSLVVDMGESTVSVTDARKLTLTITDRRTYEKKQVFSDVAGKQGDMKGTFAIPVDLDGLLMNNTYIFTLNAYLYDKNSETYTQQDIGTIAVRTDETASVKMGMQASDNGGLGVNFWMGAETYGTARDLDNYYSKDQNSYIDENGYPDEDASTYIAKTSAAYRNLSSMIFEMYKGNSTTPADTDLVGTCEISDLDDDGNKIQTIPGYSELYKEYYGSAIQTYGTNSVGVGDSFAHRFEYYTPNTGKTGIIPESALGDILPSAECTIRVRYVYDYTYDRRYLFNESYDYFLPNPSLNEEDYVNALLINEGQGCILPGLRYQQRPVSPEEMIDQKTGYALTLQTVNNQEMASFRANATKDQELYDDGLEAETQVGLDIGSYFNDRYKMTKTISVYGTTYDPYTNQWTDGSQSLDVMRDKMCTNANGQETSDYIFPFKFTLNMTTDGKDDEKSIRRDTMPKLRLLMYDSRYGWDNYFQDNGFRKTKSGDRGYQWYKYDSKNDRYLIYTDVSFLKRGSTYIFAYDAVMDFVDGDNGGNFQYPVDYYNHGWIAGKVYNKTTVLQSSVCSLEKQIPQMDLHLKQTERKENSFKKMKKNDKWQMSLYDPDEALEPELLLGYSKKSTLISGLYSLAVNGTGSPLYQQGDYITIQCGDVNIFYYQDEDSEQMVAEVRRGSTTLKDRAEAIEAVKEVLTNMRTIHEENPTDIGKIGTEVTIGNIPDDQNIAYSWRGVYRTVTDYLPQRHDGMIPLAEHQIYGYYTMVKPDTENAPFNLVCEVDEDTHDKFTVSLEPKAGEYNSIYETAVSRITGVRIRAKDKNGKYISDGSTPREVWAGLSGSRPRKFNFWINSFNTSSHQGDLTIELGEKLTFEYEFYYYAGDYDTSAAEENTYYRMKQINATTPKGVYYDEEDGIRKIGSYNGHIVKLPEQKLAMVTMKGNNGTIYLKSLTDTVSMEAYGIKNRDELTATVNLRRGQDEKSDYNMGRAVEFCRLQKVSASWTYKVQPMIPSLRNHWERPKLTKATLEGSINNYQLMPYPKIEGETREQLHLYYALYEEVPDDGDIHLELKTVWIGEPKTLYDEYGHYNFELGDLKRGTTYRLYMYYKDNRNDDAKTDQQIFGRSLPTTPGEQITGADAQALAQIFTPTKDGKLNPESNEVLDNKMTKLPDMPAHEIIPADPDTGAAAVYDYYVDFTTVNGIPFKTLTSTLETGLDYVDEHGASAKTLTINAEVNSSQDDHTKVYLAVERCVAGSESKADAWHTVLANQGYDGEKERALLEEAGLWCDWEIVNSNLSQNASLQYFENYPQCTRIGMYGSDTIYPKITMPVYPEGVFQPGYTYRVKGVVFQYDDNDQNPQLVSLESEDSAKRCRLSDSTTWELYQYSELRHPVTITNVVQEVSDDAEKESTLSATMNIRYLNYVDKKIYVRLCEEQRDGSWEILEDDQYYDTLGTDSTTINKTAFEPGTSYKLKFRHLKKNTTYRMQFYALVDRDYDNYVDLMEDGVPLKANASDTKIYQDLNQYYGNPKASAPENNLKALYQQYYRSDDPTKVPTDLSKASKLLLDWSSGITTFKEGQLGTIGRYYQADVDSTGTTLTLHFADASGLGKADICQYYIKYVPNPDDTTSTGADVTGTVKVASAITGASGNVEMVIKNANLQMNNKGTYYIQMQLMMPDGTTVFEKPDTITMIVD